MEGTWQPIEKTQDDPPRTTGPMLEFKRLHELDVPLSASTPPTPPWIRRLGVASIALIIVLLAAIAAVTVSRRGSPALVMTECDARSGRVFFAGSLEPLRVSSRTYAVTVTFFDGEDAVIARATQDIGLVLLSNDRASKIEISIDTPASEVQGQLRCSVSYERL